MSDVPLFILYGSATGNAEFIAKDLADKYKDKIPSPFNKIVCHEANDFKKKCLPIWEKEPPQDVARKYGLVFITSTTGNGDSPENGSRFIRYLKRKTTAEALPMKHVAYGILGLGDTNYDMFCESGKVADKKLRECGGERVKPLGMADEGTGLEDVVDSWVEDIVPILAKACKPVTTDQEEKKSEDSAPVVAHPGSRPSIPAFKGLPNVQTILNQRLGRSGAAAPTVGSIPNVPAVGSRPTIPSIGSRPNVPAVGSRPAIPSIGSRPNIPAVDSRPTIPSIGSRPNIPAVGSRPAIPSAGTSKPQPPVAKIGDSEKKVMVTKIKSPSPLFILYGSATGNSEQIAKNLSVEYNKMLTSNKDGCYFPEVICCELDQYKKKCIKIWEDDAGLNNDFNQKHGVLIVTSTTGNGEFPENASRFTRYVKRKTTVETMPFKHVAYAVLGLGDTNYDQFCEAGKLIDRKLNDLGGTRIKDIACADEGTGLEQVVDPWIKNIIFVVSEGCQGKQRPQDDKKSSGKAEEEKSSDNLPTSKSSVAQTNPLVESSSHLKCTMSETGVSVITKLLGNNVIPAVDVSLLPSLGTSLSSCQLFQEDETLERKSSRGLSLSEMEKLTVSSASSSNIHYTLNDPFESTIVGARYLTQTNLKGAKLACDALDCRKTKDTSSREEGIIRAMKCLQDSFPLDKQTASQREAEDNGKRVIEMKLSLPEDFTLEYQPGDSVGLVVSNSAAATKFVLDMLHKHHGLASTQKVSLDEKNPITVAAAVRDRIDLCSPIKNKRLLASLAQFASNPDEANALNMLASKDPVGQDLFARYIDQQRMCALDILTQFPSCQSITLEGLLSILPGIAPRYYSISSSPLGQKDASLQLTVAFSVVDYITPILILADGTKLQRRTGGLATRYLEAMCAPHFIAASDIEANFSIDRVRIFPKPTAEFRLPASLTTPMILIGPGTGVAPFIGFLKHREAQLTAMHSTKAANVASEGTWRGGFDLEEEDLSLSKKDAKGLIMGADYRSDQRIGNIALYYGCRHQDHDWLYQSEMESLEKSGVVSLLRIAFSRDSEVSKCYVQDKLRNDAKIIAKMVTEDNASIYICGDGNAMAKDVQKALVEIFAENKFRESSSSQDDAIAKAASYMEGMKAKSKLLLDIWS